MRAKPLLHFVNVVGEGHIEKGIVIEIDDEYFVLRIGFAHHRQGRGFYACALGAHAAAVVDHDSKRNRNIFPLENFDLLRLAVLENFEIALVEVS